MFSSCSMNMVTPINHGVSMINNNNNNNANINTNNNFHLHPNKSNTNIELASNLSAGNIQNNSKVLNITTLNKENMSLNEIKFENCERPIDKFKRVVSKIIRRTKEFLEYLENEKNIIIKRETQTA